jgi:preprotein translocase subunit SecG
VSVYLNVAQILISLLLIFVVLLQSKGSSFSGAFSNDASVFRTRRGLEKTLFQLSLGLAGVFVVISILSVFVARSLTG